MGKKTAPQKLPQNILDLFEEAKASNTKKAYVSDLVIFYDWLDQRPEEEKLPISQHAVIEYLIERSETDALSTLKRRLSSISWLHLCAGYSREDNPGKSSLVLEVLKSLKVKYAREDRQVIDEAAPLDLEQIREMVMLCKADKNIVRGARDRAIILLGFSGGLRRSEIVALKWGDIQEVVEGLEITVRKSKTDQQGKGAVVRCYRGSVPATCPVRALADWRSHCADFSGHIFRRLSKSGKLLAPLARSGQSINRIIQHRAREMELPDWKDYSAHSLRRGFASTAIKKGASIRAVMTQGRWLREETLMIYVKNKENWESAASAKLGL